MSEQKTSPPSARKLQKLRKKGTVPISQNFNAAVCILSFTIVLMTLGAQFFEALIETSTSVFQNLGATDENTLENSLFDLGEKFGWLLAIPFGLTLVFGFLQAGPTWSLEKITPDPNRLHPFSKFKANHLKQSIWKITSGIVLSAVMLVLTATITRANLPNFFNLTFYPTTSFKEVFFPTLLELTIFLSCVYFTFSIVDLVFQRKAFLSEHKMTHEEVKQEQKEESGQPLSKNYQNKIRKEHFAND